MMTCSTKKMSMQPMSLTRTLAKRRAVPSFSQLNFDVQTGPSVISSKGKPGRSRQIDCNLHLRVTISLNVTGLRSHTHTAHRIFFLTRASTWLIFSARVQHTKAGHRTNRDSSIISVESLGHRVQGTPISSLVDDLITGKR
jgi:hypothetical protein